MLLYQRYIFLVSCLKQLSQAVWCISAGPQGGVSCLLPSWKFCFFLLDCHSLPPHLILLLVPCACDSALDVGGVRTRVRRGRVSSLLGVLTDKKKRQCICSPYVMLCWAAHEWDEGRAAGALIIEAEKSEGLWRDVIRRCCVYFQVLYWNFR